ncbi:WW domain-binding protein 4-like isoform X2 [Euwallacea fornicatus]|uniref:WW domain-binding protein 4-like isoform X2 n=1 Tax=Euwallacea fornicatus TaxID=995702 RepID=UPI00338D549C
MADYWKSQDRKYCDFCKCWITDNKASRDFHENGRRHKENVKKRLKNIIRDSAKTQKETQKVDVSIRAMEAAALEAYRKDVESNSSADLTSIAMNKKLKDGNLEIASGNSNKVWREMVATGGKSYYWNTITNETTWSPPAIGFFSVLDQKAEKNKAIAKQYREVERYNRREDMLRKQDKEQEEAEERARLAREKLKERRVQDEIPEPVYGPIIDPGRNDPYGKWYTVPESTAAEIDYQLPAQEYFECPIVVEPEPTVKEFKEKTVENIDASEGESSFKKRKLSSMTKKNMRQRLDVD